VSTIKSSAEDLTLNADGSGNDIKFQSDGVEKASISSAGLLTSTTIDATALTGNLPAISGASLTALNATALTGNLPAISGSSLTGLVALTAIQSWSGSQRGTPSTVTDGTLDLDTANNFQYTPAGADVFEFTNEEAGQSGFVKLINPSGHAISVGSEVKKGESWDVSTAGTYLVSYYCDGTNVYVSASEALS
jgi:hypothetical protein